MDEYLSEQEQWDRLKVWLKTNGAWVVGGVAIGLLGLWGWRAWEARTVRLAIEAGSRYEQMIEALQSGERKRALAVADDLARAHPDSPYTVQAQLAAAKAFVGTNELERAADWLTRAMNTTEDPQLALVARLRLARVQIAQGKADQALATLDAAEPGTFAPAFSEARGDALLAKGERAAALAEYRRARAAGEGGSVDSTLLDLKINDLVAAAK